ncbi:MAG: hypothetical protein ABDH21_06145 [bacterium]
MVQKGKTYIITSITKDKPQYMNYGLIENAIIKIIDKSIDNKTIFIEIMGFNRKIAISEEFLNEIILTEFDENLKKGENKLNDSNT